MPGGWEALHLLEATITSGSQELDRLRFDIEDNKLTVGDQDLIVGTGATATSEYLRVNGADVIVTTGGANLSFEVDAKVLKTIPGDARFVLGVVDDLGESAEVTRSLAAPEGGGITWATVLALILTALLIGGFLGNLVASKRRAPARPRCTPRSITACVEREQDHRTLTGPDVYGLVADRVAADGHADSALWDRLSDLLDPTSYRPQLRTYIEIREFTLKWGNDYAMVANPTRPRALPLRPRVELLALMDGTRTVKELVSSPSRRPATSRSTASSTWCDRFDRNFLTEHNAISTGSFGARR